MTVFRVGDIVVCQRKAPAKGTWSRYRGRRGRVVVADNYGEVGVSWSETLIQGNERAESWFLPSELSLEARGGAWEPLNRKGAQ